jgi:hypothetical protein
MVALTEATEHKPEFTEKDFGIRSRRVWIHLVGETRDGIYSDATLCDPPAGLCITLLVILVTLRGIQEISLKMHARHTDPSQSFLPQMSQMAADTKPENLRST